MANSRPSGQDAALACRVDSEALADWAIYGHLAIHHQNNDELRGADRPTSPNKCTVELYRFATASRPMNAKVFWVHIQGSQIEFARLEPTAQEQMCPQASAFLSVDDGIDIASLYLATVRRATLMP